MVSLGQVLASSYDGRLVALSVLVAILGSYAALDLARRVTSARGAFRLAWLGGGAIPMGTSIWSMHYLGMLAFRLPVPVQYDWPTVLLSWLAAVAASAVALFAVSRSHMGFWRAALGSLFMGGGIAAMHYTGMAAMRMPAICHYSHGLVIVSVVFAIVISFVALWLTFRFRHDRQAWSWRKALTALVMGSAIPIMHYTAMAAATFTPSSTTEGDLSHAISVSSFGAAPVSVVTFVVLGFVLLTGLRSEAASTTRQLGARYFLFLGLISFLSILSTLLVKYQGQWQSDARVVNMAGRQGMLSQAIAKQALLIEQAGDIGQRRRLAATLAELDSQWEHSRFALQHGDPLLGLSGTNSPEVHKMLAELEPHYRVLHGAAQSLAAKAVAEDKRVDVSAEVNTILAHEGAYLQDMEAVVSQYGHEARIHDDRKNRLEFGLLLAILTVLLLQGLLVLRPALNRIQQSISALEQAQHRLQRKSTFVELLQVVAMAANEAASVEAALQFTVDRICERTGWPIGHVYFCAPKNAGRMFRSEIWHFDDASRFNVLREATAKTPLKIGDGLPGRVAESGKPAWIPDINQDAHFPGRNVAVDLGVKGAFGFPVLAQGEVAAVLEFFSTKVEQPDNELLGVMAHLGKQVGQLMERKRAEQEAERRAEELARSNAELEVFAYVASHDLQEPLRMVASYTQLLARRYKGKLGSDADEFIGFAVDGATRMQTLIQDLLSYSRVTSRGKALQPTETRIACDAALKNLQTAIQESSAAVNVGPLPAALGDEAQLTQLFQNLIGNAIKYRNHRQPKIDVAARGNGDEWIFSVQDNGIGIDPQYFQRIFQMFQRLHTRKDYAGTGIGLAVCRKIVERHGGRIWVESAPGEGSTFFFTLPRGEKDRR